MCMSRPNSSIPPNPPRNYLISSLGHMKSLHSQAPIPSPYNFMTVSALYTWFSTYPCWNQQPQTQSLIVFNPHPCQLLLMMNQNLKSPKSSIPRLTTDDKPENYGIFSIGQDMRALTRKLSGYSLPS